MNKNKWKSNRGLKIVLTILSILMAAVVFFSAAAVILIGSMDEYTNSRQECLERHYERYSYIYAVMAIANRESKTMQEELDKTNFRYGIIRNEDLGTEGITDLREIKKLSDPTIYEYCNFETMPDVEAIERGEFRVDGFEVGKGTHYSWDCRLFGYASVYYDYDEEVAEYVMTEEVPIIGYYYNVTDGIFYYETEEQCYRVDEVELYVGNTDAKMRFQYDPGQGAYYNLDREDCVVKDYYLRFNAFDDYAGRSWETWNTITLDGMELNHTNVRFVNDEDTENGRLQGKPIAENYYSYSDGSGALTVRVEVTNETSDKAEGDGPVSYFVISQVRDPLVKTGIQQGYLEGDLFEQAAYVMDLAYTWRYAAIVILVVSVILWIAATVVMLIMAGHRGYYETVNVDGGKKEKEQKGTSVRKEDSFVRGDDTGQKEESYAAGGMETGAGIPAETEESPAWEHEEQEERGGADSLWVDVIRPGFWQKIPLDVETCMLAILGVCALACMIELTYYGIFPWNIALAVLGGGFCYLICLIWLTDFVVRVKLGKWWRSMFVYRCCAWLWRKASGFVKRVFRFFRENISLLWKGIVILGGISFLEGFGILLTGFAPEAELLIWFLYRAATVALILIGIVQADKLKEGARKLADGDLQEKISTEKMFWEFKKHGEALNSIGDGMSLAVEKRMQSEHFRTELITNVSHDIKTPLTSIINYVDLLQKEEIGNETAKEYLEVLNRQSARLKKLTEDLIEASKASTGSMPVQIENLELGVFLTQTVGEFEEKLEAAGLRVVMRKPEKEIFVNADGRHLWRVVENLVQNICKYAQPDTRVYIDLDEKEKEAVISFKNISRYELNISGDELMERFVRGDASRHTEGSGLGLSIAGSLMELMNGRLEIVVDGDLFKVVLHFPKS